MSRLDDRDYQPTLDAYFDQTQLSAHNIQSYNQFINHDVSRIINQHNPFTFTIERKFSPNTPSASENIKYIDVEVRFDDVSIFRPQIQEITGRETIDEETGKIRENVYELYPQMARNNNLTYQSPVHVKVSYKVFLKDQNRNIVETFSYTEPESEKLGDMPVMLRSNLCNLHGLSDSDMLEVQEDPFDLGGYFIMKGSEKVIISQERRNENYTLLFHNKESSDWSVVCEIKSIRDDLQEYRSVNIKVKYQRKSDQIFVSINPGFGSKDIPITVLFRALGIERDIDIARYCIWDLDNDAMLEILRPSLFFRVHDTKTKRDYQVRTQREALSYIADKIIHEHQKMDDPDERVRYTQGLINKYLFPHVIEEMGGVQPRKAGFLGLMTRKLILGKLNLVHGDDRDDLSNKRIDLAGPLLVLLYRYSFSIFLEVLKKNIEKEFNSKLPNSNDSLKELFSRAKNIKYMNSTIKSGLMRGIWKYSRNQQNTRVGVAQLLQRKSYFDTVSNLRRIFTPTTGGTSTIGIAAIRRLHPSQWGLIDPLDTPDGQQTGVVKNMAMTCNITITSNETPIIEILNHLTTIENKITTTEKLALENASKMTIIMINGTWYGATSDPKYVVNFLRQKRRDMYIDPFTSITWIFAKNEIIISTDGGRSVRPVFRVDPNNKLLMNKTILEKLITQVPEKRWKWTDLLANGIVEFIDTQEAENNAVIALYPNDVYNADPKTKIYTHCEIHPMTILGAIIGLIPYSDHNQSPRNLFQASMCKQAIDLYSSAFNIRMDTSANVLHYPQRPLVSTYMSKIVKYDQVPCGQNAIVAIAMYTGYNQEDSLIVNRSSVERGLFNSSNFKGFKEEAKNDETFQKPDQNRTQGMKNSANYAKLNDSGIVPPGTPVQKGDVLIGKIFPLDRTNKVGNYTHSDSSLIMKEHKGIVDRIITGRTDDGYEVYKVSVRKSMEPKIGDKLCFDTDTEILTSNGWKTFSTFSLQDDDVMTYDPNKETLSYTKATNYYVYDHDGPIYTAQTDNINFKITPNHKLYTMPLIPNTTNNEQKRKQYKLIPVEELTQLPNQIKLEFMVNPKFHTDDYSKISTFDLDPTDPHNIYTELLYPEQLNQSRARVLMKMVIANLTNLTENEPFKKKLITYFHVSSPRLADAIQRLAIHAGYQCNIRKNTTFHKYHLTITTYHKTFYLNPHTDIKQTHYKGQVWCVSTQTGILMTRRNGIPSLSGNSSRAGQKGVVGMLYHQADMPFTKSGIVPDIIMNPQAIPSRMTLGQLMECITGKQCAQTGTFADASPFTNINYKDITKALQEQGFSPFGKEILYNGMTGEQMEAHIFIGPTFYQRLKHMVSEKIHARDTGSVQQLTRQPLEGRARDGGLRFGEMERDAMIAHGTLQFLEERFYNCSDKYSVYVCDICGQYAITNPEESLYYCKGCEEEGRPTNVSRLDIPYAAKLLTHVIQSMGVSMRIFPKNPLLE